jgi:hypothetical protein
MDLDPKPPHPGRVEDYPLESGKYPHLLHVRALETGYIPKLQLLVDWHEGEAKRNEKERKQMRRLCVDRHEKLGEIRALLVHAVHKVTHPRLFLALDCQLLHLSRQALLRICPRMGSGRRGDAV